MLKLERKIYDSPPFRFIETWSKKIILPHCDLTKCRQQIWLKADHTALLCECKSSIGILGCAWISKQIQMKCKIVERQNLPGRRCFMWCCDHQYLAVVGHSTNQIALLRKHTA